MAGYSETPLWRKLGLKADQAVVLIDAPADFSIPGAPAGVERERGSARARSGAEVILAFCSSLADVRRRLPALGERIYPAGALWIAWPRRAGGHHSDVREQDIRDLALPLGLVDVKVAALDEHWSGLRLVWRLERRGAARAGRR